MNAQSIDFEGNRSQSTTPKIKLSYMVGTLSLQPQSETGHGELSIPIWVWGSFSWEI